MVMTSPRLRLFCRQPSTKTRGTRVHSETSGLKSGPNPNQGFLFLASVGLRAAGVQTQGNLTCIFDNSQLELSLYEGYEAVSVESRGQSVSI